MNNEHKTLTNLGEEWETHVVQKIGISALTRMSQLHWSLKVLILSYLLCCIVFYVLINILYCFFVISSIYKNVSDSRNNDHWETSLWWGLGLDRMYDFDMGKSQVLDFLSFFPARIIEIWRPLLKAWLKSSLIWNSDTKGNQDKITIGMNITKDIMHSYALANSIKEFQNPIPFKAGLHAWPICEEQGIKELGYY